MTVPSSYPRAYAALLIALLVLCPYVFALTAVGTISQLAGDPKVTRAGQTLPATLAVAVDLLDQFTTDGDSSLRRLTMAARSYS